jgi:hypothetical protein
MKYGKNQIREYTTLFKANVHDGYTVTAATMAYSDSLGIPQEQRNAYVSS